MPGFSKSRFEKGSGTSIHLPNVKEDLVRESIERRSKEDLKIILAIKPKDLDTITFNSVKTGWGYTFDLPGLSFLLGFRTVGHPKTLAETITKVWPPDEALFHFRQEFAIYCYIAGNENMWDLIMSTDDDHTCEYSLHSEKAVEDSLARYMAKSAKLAAPAVAPVQRELSKQVVGAKTSTGDMKSVPGTEGKGTTEFHPIAKITVPKGYFASVLPEAVIKQLGLAKKQKKKDLQKRIAYLTAACEKMEKDPYAGTFGLWLRTLSHYARANSPSKGVIWDLASESIGALAKGRTEALKHFQARYSKVLTYTNSLPALLPLTEGDREGEVPVVQSRLKDIATTQTSGFKARCSNFWLATKGRVTKVADATFGTCKVAAATAATTTHSVLNKATECVKQTPIVINSGCRFISRKFKDTFFNTITIPNSDGVNSEVTRVKGVKTLALGFFALVAKPFQSLWGWFKA